MILHPHEMLHVPQQDRSESQRKRWQGCFDIDRFRFPDSIDSPMPEQRTVSLLPLVYYDPRFVLEARSRRQLTQYRFYGTVIVEICSRNASPVYMPFSCDNV